MGNPEKLFEIELTETEVQIVFNALLDRPFKEVANLVKRLQDIYRGSVEQPEPQDDIK